MSTTARLRDAAQQVRRLVPLPLIPGLVRRRVDQLWADPAFRASQERQMAHLLDGSPRADEIPELARAYAEHSMRRRYLRWHPRTLARQEVRGVEWLTTRRDRTRPTVLSFMHHHHYEGLFASLGRHGVEVHILALAEAMSQGAPADIRQHMRIVSSGGTLISTTGGTQGVLDEMLPGRVMAIASDVPSQTPVSFLGKTVLGALGAARIAQLTDAPVVIVTAVRDDDRHHHLQVHPPLEPNSFPDPQSLLAAMLAIHEEAILAWPEAVENPVTRWGVIEDGDRSPVQP